MTSKKLKIFFWREENLIDIALEERVLENKRLEEIDLDTKIKNLEEKN